MGSGFAGEVFDEVVEAALMPVRPGDALKEAVDGVARQGGMRRKDAVCRAGRARVGWRYKRAQGTEVMQRMGRCAACRNVYGMPRRRALPPGRRLHPAMLRRLPPLDRRDRRAAAFSDMAVGRRLMVGPPRARRQVFFPNQRAVLDKNVRAALPQRAAVLAAAAVVIVHMRRRQVPKMDRHGKISTLAKSHIAPQFLESIPARMGLPSLISKIDDFGAAWADQADFVAGGGAPALGVMRVVVDGNGMLAHASADDGFGELNRQGKSVSFIYFQDKS